MTDSIQPFNTIQYTSTKDGNTYCARKMAIKDPNSSQKVEGVYVWNKNAKPDANGQIQGSFMSQDTFMKEMADSLPQVDPNDKFIRTSK